MEYTLPKFDKYRNWIKEARDNDYSWDDLLNGLPDQYDSLTSFLANMKKVNFWDIQEDAWKNIVDQEKKVDEDSKEFEDIDKGHILVDVNAVSNYTIPQSPDSAWQKYKARLRKNGFGESSIYEIENSTLAILKMLQKDSTEVRKGMVMGNVQSGKTANMAALMAMAADWGWNMFIILSGTIENLRLQTLSRLLEDLAGDSSVINWRGIEKPSTSSKTDKTSDLNLSNNSANFTVCLKNKSRLTKLIQWLQFDQKKKRQMKIIVIDDEADQAGVNTSDINKEVRNAINRLIVNLVNNQKPDGKKTESSFQAMNYIGYTATPYANFLNEANDISLYPKHFITTLSNPPEYFGPQVIFGVEGIGNDENDIQYDGLDVVREVNSEDVKVIKSIHDGKSDELPESLKQAIGWFLAGTAALRYLQYMKPISMLVHTSQIQDHHNNISVNIECWLRSNKSEVLSIAEQTYNEEIRKFSLDKFMLYRNSYPNLDSIKDYPKFEVIKNELDMLLEKVTSIPLNEDKELDYQRTLHLCIDNCANNGIDDEGMFKRLMYPSSKQLKSINYAPAFIVVGGATLSRGLTIEGLICSYFLRSGNQADTLMQMGRWFGYRRGYELFPRIWMTDNTIRQFRFLSTLDFELRSEIKSMVARGVRPSEYGPRIKNSPKVQFIRITSAKKMQSAVLTDLDYSGSHNQTVIFEDDSDILQSNLNLTQEFLENLPNPEYSEGDKAVVWRDIDHRDIFEKYLYKFKFSSNNIVFSDVEGLYNWVDMTTVAEKLGPWNVVAAGLTKNSKNINLWKIGKHEITTVKRTRRKTAGNKFDIGVLRGPSDLIVDAKNLSKEQKEKLAKIKDTDYYEKRRVAGLDETPQLLIYRIDKNSKAESDKQARQDLDTKVDVIGICITIPGSRNNNELAQSITIKLDPGFKDDDFDMN